MRIAAIPAAPELTHSVAFSSFTPPIAITGMRTALHTWVSRAIPCGGPYDFFDGVSKMGPKKT